MQDFRTQMFLPRGRYKPRLTSNETSGKQSREWGKREEGEIGLREIRKLLFPISHYPPRCDKRRERKRSPFPFFFSFSHLSTTPRFSQHTHSPAAQSRPFHFLKREPRCVEGARFKGTWFSFAR